MCWGVHTVHASTLWFKECASQRFYLTLTLPPHLWGQLFSAESRAPGFSMNEHVFFQRAQRKWQDVPVTTYMGNWDTKPQKEWCPPKIPYFRLQTKYYFIEKNKVLQMSLRLLGWGCCVPVRGRGKRIRHTERRLCKETAGETRNGWYWGQGHKLRDVWQLILIDNLMECGIS